LALGVAALALLGALSVGAVGCATYQDALHRGQRYYDENEFEKALALWRALEDDMDSLEEKDRARYAYLRGMTDYRLGFRPHARHWLAIAKALEEVHPGGLPEDWTRRADEALADLNREVYGGAQVEEVASSSTKREEVDAEQPSAPSGCRTDSDCAAHEVCVSKSCVEP
jgi:hypothetical protein